MPEFLTALAIAAAALWVTLDAIADPDFNCSTDDRACVYGSDD